jgi:hypothetical protein
MSLRCGSFPSRCWDWRNGRSRRCVPSHSLQAKDTLANISSNRTTLSGGRCGSKTFLVGSHLLGTRRAERNSGKTSLTPSERKMVLHRTCFSDESCPRFLLLLSNHCATIFCSSERNFSVSFSVSCAGYAVLSCPYSRSWALQSPFQRVIDTKLPILQEIKSKIKLILNLLDICWAKRECRSSSL